MDLTGKLFETGGGRKGYWLVIGHKDNGICVCLGLDYDFNLVSAATYQQHYVARKETVRTVDITKVRFTN